MNLAEKILQQKATGTNGEIFLNQWNIARIYTPKILTVISHLFPHYSLHDVSHSQCILSNIIRLIGEDVLQKFSVGDLWLLLSSAYYHDIGMFVSAKDKQDILDNNPEYINYIRTILSDEKSDMFEHASIYKIVDDKLYFNNVQASSANFDSLRYLLAGYIRSIHAIRSEEHIEVSNDLMPPICEIPKRLKITLAKICKCHGQTRKSILDLSFQESSGFDNDVCHPRFIAALLRLGDLLDVDNGRISDVLSNSINNIPYSSLSYNQINMDIEHINITKQSLELRARCKKRETACLIQSWFNLIREEVIFQMGHWNDIVPSLDYGSLPMIKELKVIPDGYEIMDDGSIPTFNCDKYKAFELIQGSNIYKYKDVFVREILQNSIDAIILRLYNENKFGTSYEDFKKNCREYGEITISLSKDVNANKWECKISDNGIGMKKSELHFLYEIGASSKDSNRLQAINKMPEWMRPSGQFGIGFQSLFLVTDEIKIETRSIYSSNTYTMILNDPIKNQNSPIFIQSKDGGVYGTTISFLLKFNNHGIEVKSEQRKALNFLNNFDFVKEELSDIDIIKVLDNAIMIASTSNMKITVKYENNPMEVKQIPYISYFDQETNIELSISKENSKTMCFYRNQRIDNGYPFLDDLPIIINILSSQAKQVLDVDRDKIRYEYQDKLKNDVEDAVCRCFSQEKYYMELDEKYRPFMSARLNYFGVKSDDNNISNDWKQIEISFISVDNKEVKEKVKDIIKREQIYFMNGVLGINNEGIYYFTKNDIYLNHSLKFLMRLIDRNFKDVMFVDKYCVCSNPSDKDNTKKNLIKAEEKTYVEMLNLFKNLILGIRYFMPCNDTYKCLQVKKSPSYINEPILGFLDRTYPIAVSPFVLKEIDGKKKLVYDVDDKVIDFVLKNKVEGNESTKKEIQEAYELMKSDYEKALVLVNKKN